MDVYIITNLVLEHSTVMTFLPFLSLDQWFSNGDDFVPQKTVGNVWRHCWMPHWGLVVCY